MSVAAASDLRSRWTTSWPLTRRVSRSGGPRHLRVVGQLLRPDQPGCALRRLLLRRHRVPARPRGGRPGGARLDPALRRGPHRGLGPGRLAHRRRGSRHHGAARPGGGAGRHRQPGARPVRSRRPGGDGGERHLGGGPPRTRARREHLAGRAVRRVGGGGHRGPRAVARHRAATLPRGTVRAGAPGAASAHRPGRGGAGRGRGPRRRQAFLDFVLGPDGRTCSTATASCCQRGRWTGRRSS